jgi:UPF0271 protein
MLSIDLNCDVGEGCGNDSELLRLVSSANIACGYHAGDAETMRRTVDLAVANGISIGAHPGYPDRENFGRLAVDLSPYEVSDMVTDQVSTLKEISTAAGGELDHVKPHGALYNRSAKDPELAAAVARAVRSVDPKLILVGLSGSHSILEARKIGCETASEVFADRTYQTDGSLTPRSHPHALIHDADKAAGQVLDMVKYGRVRSVQAIMIQILAETVCIHGDGDSSLEIAHAITLALQQNHVTVRSLNGRDR